MIKIKAPAKINLTLEVIKKMPNGYHQLRSVMFKSDNLYDELDINFYSQKKECKIVCANTEVPTDGNNIVFKIAQEFFQVAKKSIGFKIKIDKRIPIASGLGGGSSDGASFLIALNEYFQNPFSQLELIDIASRVGKDIPFFLQKEKGAYVTGMGEKVRPIKNVSSLAILIINIKGKISTPWAFQELDKKLRFMEDERRVNISQKLVTAIQERKSLQGLLYNDFDLIAEEKYPQVKSIKKMLLSFGALGTSLSGKGPAVIGIFEKNEKAIQVKKILQRYYSKIDVKLG